MKLSTEAWIGLICLIALVVGINLPLGIALLSRKQIRMPFFHSPDMPKVIKTIRQPWHEEDEQLDELSKKVKTIQNTDDEKK